MEEDIYFDEQSRGVPSATVRPGMFTPFAPWISVTTPWLETEAARAATSANFEMYMIAGYKVEINSRGKVWMS